MTIEIAVADRIEPHTITGTELISTPQAIPDPPAKAEKTATASSSCILKCFYSSLDLDLGKCNHNPPTRAIYGAFWIILLELMDKRRADCFERYIIIVGI